MNNRHIILALFILLLAALRIYTGLQINFMHEDYIQIYLIGLENALSEDWTYWGADVVWSETRVPGALQGLIGGIPLRTTASPSAPIVFSNLLSILGLLLIAFYAKKRFPSLSIYFLVGLFMLSPFMFINGIVLLNTAHLVLSGAFLFISVFELFLYRDSMLYGRNLYFFGIGFGLLLTYQLHLTWVMFLPFILILPILEYKRSKRDWWNPLLFMLVGSILAGLTLIPTIIKYWDAIFTNVQGNLVFKPKRFLEIFDLAIRYLGMATFDILHQREPVQLAMDKHLINKIFIWTIKTLMALQFIAFLISFFRIKSRKDYRNTLLLFLLTLLMALGLFVLSNKHLSVRTYILLYPVPIWLSLYAYEYLFKNRLIRVAMYTSMTILSVTFLSLGISNHGDEYSLYNHQSKIREAIQLEDPYVFGKRRETLMDPYN